MRNSTEIDKEDTMDLYFSPLACSMSGRIAFAEAGQTVNLIEVDPDTKTVLATGEDYRAINPLGYVPALRLDDGTVLTENAAILQYVADAFPDALLAPPEDDRLARAKLRQWLSFIGSELHKALLAPLISRTTPAEVRAWVAQKYASRLTYLNTALAGREFLMDHFTVADGYLATVLNWTRAIPEIDLATYPNVKAYLDRMRQRPSVASALNIELPLYQAETARTKAA
jgi:glutathione S-transferase